MYQLSIEDIERRNSLALQPGRTAFIDECGNFGFDFEKEGTSLYYVVCAVIVKNDQIGQLETAVNELCRKYFGNGEMKSSSIGKDHNRRAKICTELLKLDFSLIILIADKQAFFRDSPLTNYNNLLENSNGFRGLYFRSKLIYSPLKSTNISLKIFQ